MKSKKGFISMSLVYSFLIVFLFLMLSIMSRYSEKIRLLNTINDRINKDISSSISTNDRLFNKIIDDNILLNTSSINYSLPSSSINGNGLIHEESANGKNIYFYRGNVSNNYVIFGDEYDSATATTSNKICWRILRTNDDSSIRLVYAGKANSSKCNSTSQYITLGGITTFGFNNNSNDNAYVGYTYGQTGATNFDDTHYFNKPTNDSVAKSKLEEWYKKYTNLAEFTHIFYPGTERVQNKKLNLIEDSTYCSDRSVSGASGYGNINTTYGSRKRLNLKENPTFECNKEDSYNLSYGFGGVNDSSTAIEVPAGLLSVDDVRYAGGSLKEDFEYDYFLKIDKDYWTMSPDVFDTVGGVAKVFYVKSNGVISSSDVRSTFALRPVISVSFNTIIQKGIGTAENPYIIKEG